MTNSPGRCPYKLDGDMLPPCCSILAKSICTTIPHWFISFICTRSFDKNIWSSFIYLSFVHNHLTKNQVPHSFLSFFLHATIRRKYMIFFHLVFLLCTTIGPKIGFILIYSFYLHATVQQKYVVFIYFFFCGRPLDQKLGSSLI